MFEPPPLPPDFPPVWKLNPNRSITWYHYEKDGQRFPVLQRAMQSLDEWRVIAHVGASNRVYDKEWDNYSKSLAEAKVDLAMALITYGFSA